MAWALLAFVAIAAPNRLPPIDQCSADRSFRQFQSALRASVVRRDAGALLRSMSDDVMVDFDGSQGRQAFAKVWKLDGRAAARSSVWRELETVMRLGCARVGTVRIMPSLSQQLSDDDQFQKMIALPGASLRRKPLDSAPPIKSLSYDVVAVLEGDAPGEWLLVSLSDGRRGFVRRSQLRSSLQYRAQFEKNRGRWKMTSFVEGD